MRLQLPSVVKVILMARGKKASYENALARLWPYVPIFALNTVWRKLDKGSQTILDVGCGKGKAMAFLNRHRRFKVIGVDIFKPDLEEARRQGVYENLILGDVRYLPFADRSCDAVICLEVLEHLEKADAERFLIELERVVRRQILLSSPVGSFKQQPSDQNPYQEHKYIWSPEELKAKGYKVRGFGVKRMESERSWTSRPPYLVKPLGYLIYALVYTLGTVFSYFLPKIACHVVAEKRIG